MKKLVAVSAALAVSLGVHAWNALPDAKPSKPVYVQRVAALLDAANKGDWKLACDAAPTGTIGYSDFMNVIGLYRAQTSYQVEKICESIVKNGSTDDRGKALGVTYTLDWWQPETPARETSKRTVIATVTFGDRKPETFVFDVELSRIAWTPLSAKCGAKKLPCPKLKWYVLAAS